MMSRIKKLRSIFAPIVFIIACYQGLSYFGTAYFESRAKEEASQSEPLGLASSAKTRSATGAFKAQFQTFHQAAGGYLFEPAMLASLALTCGLFVWMLFAFFAKYFNLYSWPGRVFRTLFPMSLIESLPHSLVVLVVYFLLLNNPDYPFQRATMLLVFAVISLPLIHALLDDGFRLARREGVIENFLILPQRNHRILTSFIRVKKRELLFTPLILLAVLMIYWDYSYAAIKIWSDESSAPTVIYQSFNHEFLVSFPGMHSMLIALQVLIFVSFIAGLNFYYIKRR